MFSRTVEADHHPVAEIIAPIDALVWTRERSRVTISYLTEGGILLSFVSAVVGARVLNAATELPPLPAILSVTALIAGTVLVAAGVVGIVGAVVLAALFRWTGNTRAATERCLNFKVPAWGWITDVTPLSTDVTTIALTENLVDRAGDVHSVLHDPSHPDRGRLHQLLAVHAGLGNNSSRQDGCEKEINALLTAAVDIPAQPVS